MTSQLHAACKYDLPNKTKTKKSINCFWSITLWGKRGFPVIFFLKIYAKKYFHWFQHTNIQMTSQHIVAHISLSLSESCLLGEHYATAHVDHATIALYARHKWIMPSIVDMYYCPSTHWDMMERSTAHSIHLVLTLTIYHHGEGN